MPQGCRRVASGSRDSCRSQLGQGAVEDRIGALGDHNRFGDEAAGVVVAALMRRGPRRGRRGSTSPSGGSGRPSVERSGRELVGLGDPTLEQERTGEQGGGLAGVGADAETAQAIACGTQVRFGGGRVTGEQLDEPGEQLGLVEAVPQTELACRRP